MRLKENEMKSKKRFYISAINGPTKYLVAGPYSTHKQALDLVDSVRDRCNKIDPMSWFFAWGTASSAEDFTTPLGAVV